MRVLVYGATGSQMGPLVPRLLAAGHEPVVVSRNPQAAVSLPQGSRTVQADLADPAGLRQAHQGIDAVAFMLPAFLAAPAKALEYVANAAQAAAAARVKLMVWNTSGRYPLPGERVGSGAQLQDMHAVLLASALPLITIAPAKYMENLLGPWATRWMSQGIVAYPVNANRPMGWIACDDVCALIAAALDRPTLAGRLFRVSGTAAPTGPELADTFARVLQRPFRFQTLTPAQMKEALEAAFGAGSGDHVAAEYALDQADPHPPATAFDMTGVLGELPVSMTSLAEWVNKHRAIFDAA